MTRYGCVWEVFFIGFYNLYKVPTNNNSNIDVVIQRK